MTRPWLLRRLVGDARRHAGVWLALVAAFAAVGACAAGLRLATGAARALPAASDPAARLVVYLKDDLDAGAIAELERVLAKLPGVEGARTVSAGEELERLRRELGPRAAVLEGVGPDLLFPSIELSARPASAASALAFRLRRVRGVADVDLVAAPVAPALRGGSSALASRSARAVLAVAGVAAVLALIAALALLRARLGLELGVLLTFGLTRGAGAGPPLALATFAGVVGAALGVLLARAAALIWLGAALPPREAALGVAVFAGVAFVASSSQLRPARATRAA